MVARRDQGRRPARRWRRVGAVEVSLDGGGDRLGAARRRRAGRAVEPWAALLPVLDPTVMGWKERGFYLGPHGAAPLRQQRQRRHHGVVGRSDRRLLGPGRRRGGRGPPARGAAARPRRGARRRGRAAHRLAGRRTGEHRLPVHGHEGRRLAAVTRRCVSSPSSRPRRSSGCGSATPSAAGSASPATATSAAPSSGRSSGPGCRWPTPRASTRTRGSPTPAPRRPGRPARRSTSSSALAEVVDPADVHAALDEALPDGLDVVEVVESPGGGRWPTCWRPAAGGSTLRRRPRTRSRRGGGVPGGRRGARCERMTKKGLRDFDCRAAVLSLDGRPPTDGGPALELVLRHAEPAVRPDDVLVRAGRRSPGSSWRRTRCSPGWRRVRSTPRPARSATRWRSPRRDEGCRRARCAILASGRRPRQSRPVDPTTFSPVDPDGPAQ